MKHYRIPHNVCTALLILFMITGCALTQVPNETKNSKFVAIPLGTKGGLIESDLSAYLLALIGEQNFIALDAGTLMAGLKQARENGSLKGIEIPKDSHLSLEGAMLRNHIKAYVISHAHLDHVAGLVINSPDDSQKPIFGLPSTIDMIRDHLFNWKTWPNFGDEGEGVHLKKYHYVRLIPGKSQPVQNTSMTLVAFELSHSGNYLSTAFLIEANGEYILYIGDVGPDTVEKSDTVKIVWTAVAPLVRDKKLHGIFLECSFPSNRPDKLLFGHLTPKWMMEELRKLANLVNPSQPEAALNGLKVVVTHIKPSLNRRNDPETTIMKELSEQNDLGVTFILPESGKRILF